MNIRFTKGEQTVKMPKYECDVLREAASMLEYLDRMEGTTKYVDAVKLIKELAGSYDVQTEVDTPTE